MQRQRSDQPAGARRALLRRADQAVIAAMTLVALVCIMGYSATQWARRGGLIEIDRAAPRTARFEVDINTAGWPELAQLPELGETLARRIVEDREARGPFVDHDDLRNRVRGIGPRTLERMRPYLRPIPLGGDVATR